MCLINYHSMKMYGGVEMYLHHSWLKHQMEAYLSPGGLIGDW
jgi:hypothetical protein